MAQETAADAFAAALAEDDAEDLYEHAPCGYLSTLPDGTLVKVNQTFLTWTGYAGEDLVGRRRFVDLLTAGGRIYHETHYAPLLRMQGAVREIAVDIVCADGRRLPALVNAVLKRDDDGAVAATRIAVFDATDRRRYEQELLRARQRAEESEARARLLARTLQRTFVPSAPPDVPGVDVAGSYRPAGRGDEVGGDFYDVFETARGDWAVVLGDVRGKGAEAAVVTALARSTLRAAAVRARRPSLVLGTLNEVLLRHAPDRFCTVVYVRVRPGVGPHGRLTVASGGHPLPVRAHADGHPDLLGRHGTLLGVFDDPVLHDTTVDLRPGDVVVLYTDGVTEGRRGRTFFGEERLAAIVAAARGAGAGALADRLVEEVVDFQEGSPRDDIAVVVLKVPEG